MRKRGVFVGIALLIIVIGILAVTKNGSSSSTAKPVTRTKSLVSLGDSVAAGVGLKTDSDSSACNRTDQAYPNVLAKSINFSVKNLACSGATLPAGILGKQDVNQLLVTPQIDQLFALPRPDLVTVTIGANDAQWTSIIAKCYTDVCGSDADTAAVNQRLAVVSTNIKQFLTNVQQHYGTNPPPIIMTGYYQVFPTGAASCSDLTGIDAEELAWGRQQQAAISSTVEASLKDYAFAKFQPIDFTGHELCSADSWVQGLSDKQPYHPTEAGQVAIAKQLSAAYVNEISE